MISFGFVVVVVVFRTVAYALVIFGRSALVYGCRWIGSWRVVVSAAVAAALGKVRVCIEDFTAAPRRELFP